MGIYMGLCGENFLGKVFPTSLFLWKTFEESKVASDREFASQSSPHTFQNFPKGESLIDLSVCTP
ncbi:MAG: hypothetical protein IJW16_01215, partial [Clostridia bacterium]|nr:hypothetical protein [Clostridia bacterium]